MKKKLFAGLLISLTAFVFVGMAEATHIQFFDFADLDITDGTIASTSYIDSDQTPTIDNADAVTIAAGGSYSYTFDLLDADSLDLFNLDAPYAYLGTGEYDSDNFLHYVTLRIDPNNYKPQGTPSNTYMKLEVNGIVINDWSNPIRLYDWGVPGDSVTDIYGIPANGYKVNVTLTGLNTLMDGTTIPRVMIESGV